MSGNQPAELHMPACARRARACWSRRT